MADEKSVQEKNTGKPSFGTRFVNFFKNLPANIARPFRDMFYELKKYCRFCRKHTVHRETK